TKNLEEGVSKEETKIENGNKTEIKTEEVKTKIRIEEEKQLSQKVKEAFEKILEEERKLVGKRIENLKKEETEIQKRKTEKEKEIKGVIESLLKLSGNKKISSKEIYDEIDKTIK